MKKLSVMLMFALALAVFAAAPAVMACGENASKTTASKDDAQNKLVNSKSSCSASKETAQQASSKADCAATCATPCTASAKQASADKAACDAKYTMVSMNVDGMTCGSCEESVKTALANVDGVMCVKKVCHESGSALVCVDATKMKDNALLTQAVSNKGYVAEVIPAVAKTETVNSSGKTCSAAEKAACAASKAKDDAKTTAASATGTK